jgi:hypothetical protein
LFLGQCLPALFGEMFLGHGYLRDGQTMKLGTATRPCKR